MEKLNLGWKPLVQIPENVPSASFITDEAFIEEYKGRVKSDFGNASALKVLSYDNGVVKGSNFFAVALVNSIVKPLGLRVASQADLERVLSTNALELKNQYEDTALVLRNRGDPNEYLAGKLADQTLARGYDFSTPLVVPLYGVEVVKDKDSPHGLAFKLAEDTQIVRAPELIAKNNGKNFSATNEYGIPNVDGKGERMLYTRESGLLGLFLNRNLDVGSGDDYLANSGDSGRVVLVRSKI